MYIIWSNNIFSRTRRSSSSRGSENKHRRHAQPVQKWHRRQSVRRDSGSLTATSRFRALRNIRKQKRVLVSEARASRALGSITRRGSTMTNFKLISGAAILSAAIATPAFSQEAVQEPGLQAFYQSLGVGSRSSATASAMASARSSSQTSVPVKRISATQDVTVPRQHVGTPIRRKGGPMTAFSVRADVAL
jgi:hypothetical protein